jgi:signal transduction histidine kinase
VADKRTPKPSQNRSRTRGFSVDTRLFRELGELLVGRDSTALLELVKNSYDADATRVTVYGERLESGSNEGFLLVADDGNGMTLQDFSEGFLRIASRSKEMGDRRSPLFGRRYTGEKGVGRLAAHKLAEQIHVHSTSRVARGRLREGVDALIDWREIEAYESLEDAADAIELGTFTVEGAGPSGTEIRLSELRHPWTQTEITDFLVEAETFRPANVLTERLPPAVAQKPLLFSEPVVRDVAKTGDPGFDIEFQGEFEEVGEYWDAILETTEWVTEIRARRDGIVYVIAPTSRERDQHPESRRVTYRVPHPSPAHGPFFDARIFLRERGRGQANFRAWSSQIAGIRVYLEGFRVLPYGDRGNDWLGIGQDVGRRLRAFRALREIPGIEEREDDENAALLVAAPDAYVGAVFLTTDAAPDLRMLVNREGFVPNESLELLQRYVRGGVELIARSRAAGRQAARSQRRVTRRKAREEDDAPAAIQWREEVRETLRVAQEAARDSRVALASGHSSQATKHFDDLEVEISNLQEQVEALVREQSLLPVLASVGTQMAEFIHEIRGLLGLAQSADQALDRIRGQVREGKPATRHQLAELHRTVSDLRGRLERQSSYLLDLAAPATRRRRTRQSLRDRFDAAARLVERPVYEKRVRLENKIPDDLRSPPMFSAEVSAVFVNLLTNAVKAVGKDGRITATGRIDADGHTKVRVENTGLAVILSDAERWFRPFESTTVDVDPVLGQGMGLGLPITRAILEEYGARIDFIKPGQRAATAIEIDFGVT